MDPSSGYMTQHISSVEKPALSGLLGSDPLKSDTLGAHGIARALDAYLGKPLVTKIGRFGRHENRANRILRLRKALPFVTNLDILDKMSRFNDYRLKRVSNCVEAIIDCLVASSPDLIRSFYANPRFIRLKVYLYHKATLNCDELSKQWKAFSKLLKWLGVQSKTDRPDDPTDFIGFGSERKDTSCPPFWENLLPWIGTMWRNGCTDKSVCTRLMHLTSTRSTPSGGKAVRKHALEKHADTLFSRPYVSELRTRIVRKFSYLIGKQTYSLKPAGLKSNAHLSLTSSASIDSPVSEGGRISELRVKLKAWLLFISVENRDEKTWFGERYWTIAGLPRWQTMCRAEIIHKPDDIFGESAENLTLDFEDFKYEDPLLGIDNILGYQLLQFSIEQCLETGVADGCAWKNDNDKLRLGHTRSSIRASTIGEPGAKARIVTVGEDFITEVLQPFSHHLLGVMRYHPSATTGLTYGWQHYEWVKALSSKEPAFGSKTHFLSSDLETATDYCTHELSQAMLEGFMRGIKIDNVYFDFCTELLCSGRTYEGPIDECIDRVTTRGVLMGEPGSKAVLTLHNLCAEAEAYYRYNHGLNDATDEELFNSLRSAKSLGEHRKWRHFVCIGDDHTAQGPLEYLKNITKTHSRNNMKVSTSHNYISEFGSYYSEEMFFCRNLPPDKIWGVDQWFAGRPYHEHPHVDAMKMRLFSPCQKECGGKDEPNPVIGKAYSVQGMLAWLGGDFAPAVPIFSALFERRHEGYMPEEKYLRYLPRLYGGLECPAFHLSKTELRQIFNEMPECLKYAINSIIDGVGPAKTRRILSKFCTNTRARGVPDNLIEDQIREVLSNAMLVHGVTDSDLQLMSCKSDAEWVNLRYRDKVAIAKVFDLVTVDDALNDIDRPYTFRNMLVPDLSLKHGIIVPVPGEAYKTLPWKTRKDRFLFELETLEKVPLKEGQSFENLIQKTVDAVHGKRVDVNKEVYFLPHRVVLSDTLCTLRTPLLK